MPFRVRLHFLKGVQGHLRVKIRLQFTCDINPFKDSAAGVQLFSGDLVCLSFFLFFRLCTSVSLSFLCNCRLSWLRVFDLPVFFSKAQEI